MIPTTMAVAAVGPATSEFAEYARDARLARAWALLVDSLLFAILSFVVNSVYGVAQVTSGFPPTFGSTGSYSFETTISWPLLTLLYLLYYIVPEAMFGASPGKYWARLRVVRLDGRPLGVRAVVIRNIMRLIDGLPSLYLIGAASVLWTPAAQRLGDRMAGTTVVYRHRALEPGAPRTPNASARRNLRIAILAAVVFTGLFDYFGRPPLEIAGMVNTERLLVEVPINDFSLGSPTWGLGSVSYPIKTSGPTRAGDCTGTITLHWTFLFWSEYQATYTCSS